MLKNIAQMGIPNFDFKNVEFFNQDGSKALVEHAPFDKILASASVPEIPPPIKKQLKINGIAVLPVRDLVVKITKKSKSEYETEEHPFFAFVPMRGEYGKN